MIPFETEPFNGDTFLQEKFISLRDEKNITTVIETGTYKGTTTKWLAENFRNVLTVEYNKTLFEEYDFDEYPNITSWLGSSADLLPLMIKVAEFKIRDDENYLVFLDAHWYANPLQKELEAIAAAKKKPILVIHDFKNPFDDTMGYDQYPEQGIVYDYNYVRDFLKNIGEYDTEFNKEATGARRGCLFVYFK